MTVKNTVDPGTGDITTTAIRDLLTLAHTYELLARESAEDPEEFEAYDDDYLCIYYDEDGRLDYQCLAEGLLNTNHDERFSPCGQFTTDGKTGDGACTGFTFFRRWFSPDMWEAVESMFPPS